MIPLRNFLLIVFLVLLFTGVFCTFAQEPDPSNRIPGLWLYLWWHGDASVAGADGTPATKPMFIPESYGEATDPLSESFLYFRADGTGAFFRRYVLFKNSGDKITVVTKDRNGQWVKGDRLESKSTFTWKIRGDQITIHSRQTNSGFSKNGRYRFIINQTPTRPASRPISTRLKLSDELIIHQLGQFLKVGREVEQTILQRYEIDQD